MGLWNLLFGKGRARNREAEFHGTIEQVPERPIHDCTDGWRPGPVAPWRLYLSRSWKIVAEGKMPRPNDGKVEDNGVFILSDWGSIETLNGTFAAFCPDGTPILSRKLKANLFNNGLSPDGRWAVSQTANAPSDDSGRLFVFDLAVGKEMSSWQAESGWASAHTSTSLISICDVA